MVFYDAIMHDRDPAGRIAVRVGVSFAGFPVRRPAGVADSNRSGKRRLIQRILEFAHMPDRPAKDQALSVHGGQTRRVVTPVFEPFQSRHDDLGGREGS